MLNSSGPGWMPCSRKAPIITAVAPLPGMPNVSSGIMAPPVEALMAELVEFSPSHDPLPNSSGFLLTWRSTP